MKISHVRWTFYVIFLANQTSHLPKIRGPLALKTIDQQNEIFDEASKFNDDYKLAMGVAARACNPRELEHIPDQIAQAASLVRTRKSDTFVCLIWRCKKSWCWTSDGPNFWTELLNRTLPNQFGIFFWLCGKPICKHILHRNCLYKQFQWKMCSQWTP